MSSSDLSSDERERELERERPKRVLRGEIKSGDDRRERERERERRPLFFPPLKVLFLFLLFFCPVMPSIFSTKKTRALLKVKKKRVLTFKGSL